MLKAFKEFAFKGNMLDMAVGIVIGSAFSTVVKSLVDNIIMPPLGLIIAKVDFKDIKIELGGTDQEGKPVVISIGQFFNDMISFLIVAFVLFLIIKKFLALFDSKDDDAEDEEEKPSEDIVLLGEIRDLLKSK